MNQISISYYHSEFKELRLLSLYKWANLRKYRLFHISNVRDNSVTFLSYEKLNFASLVEFWY